MPRALDPHRDYTCGTFEDSFLLHFVGEVLGGFVWELFGLGLRLVGWQFWQAVRLLCNVIFEGLSAWHF